MSLLMNATQIQKLPVVTVNGGEDVAEVRDVVYSPAQGRLVGLTLNKRGRFAGRLREVLTAESIHAIGKDAVMILDDSALLAPQRAEEVAGVGGERNVVGDDVITEGGVSIGTVVDLALVVGSTGEVVGYRIDRKQGGPAYIPLPAQLAVSGSTLLVPDSTLEFVRDDLVGLGAAVEEFRARLEVS